MNLSDFDTAVRIGQLAIALVSVASLVINAVLLSKFVAKRDFYVMEKRVDAAHHRLDLVELGMGALPNREEVFSKISGLETGQAVGREKIETVRGDIGRVNETVTRLDEFLRTFELVRKS